MTAPSESGNPPALKPPAPLFATALEAVELELTLGSKENDAEQLESVVRETVESLGGVLLFHMKLRENDGDHLMAAVAFETAEDREIVVIDLPCSGGRATVSPASQSELPIASIASAYAGLAECWSKAA